MSSKITIFAILLSGICSASAEQKFNVSKIAGRTPEEVAKTLGKPSGQAKTKHGPKLLYKEGKIEIVFIGGKADWITVSNLGDLPFDANAIESLGLNPSSPTSKSDFVLRWEPCGTYNSVAIFSVNGRVDYAYIKVVTK